MRVMLLGATGTIGRATAKVLVSQGHEVVCVIRPDVANPRPSLPDGAILRFVDVTDPAALENTGFAGEGFDALVTCLASRSGAPVDAWAIDHRANLEALHLAQKAGVGHVVLLSAICVQRPQLAFQQAKLAFEAALIASGLSYSIVRPTAFFKSLSGQVDRLRQGKPFLLFGDGRLTACKPISDADLAQYLADCLHIPARHNRILPIGGPGPAITPHEQGEHLFHLLGQKPRFRHVPVGLMDGIIKGLQILSPLSRRLAAKAEFAKIGRYYATESMLVLNPETGRYEADMTPSFGTETLFDFYADLVSRGGRVDLGAHSAFKPRAA